VLCAALASISWATSANGTPPDSDKEVHPFAAAWQAAGLDERAAAAHALDRLAYGARPGEVERLAGGELVAWLEAQLSASGSDEALERRLAPLDALTMTLEEMGRTFPNPGVVRRLMQLEEGRAESGATGASAAGSTPRAARRPGTQQQEAGNDELDAGDMRELMQYAKDRGMRPQRELLAQLFTQKLLRATASEHQLQEMLVDFWFNHFNVSIRDPEVRSAVLAYERDAIRPHVFGSFGDMLEATARHPAMLGYLDNAQSRAEPGVRTALPEGAGRGHRSGPANLRRRGIAGPQQGGMQGSRMTPYAARSRGKRQRGSQPFAAPRPPGFSPPEGLNENYARELLELHTLGVDGGYTQEDVVAVARAFTGWTMVPPLAAERLQSDRLTSPQARRAGFVTDGVFVFHPGFHDAEVKTVLGKRLAPRRGIEDGLEVLRILVDHPATAHHVAHKLAVRFVADDPPESVVRQLAVAFTEGGGDLQVVMRRLLELPEFWGAPKEKIRSPFEFVVASLRALGGEVRRPSKELFDALAAMGQSLYAYDAPTGYPDAADQWLGSSSLLARMNFSMALAEGKVAGLVSGAWEPWRHSALGRPPDEQAMVIEEVVAALLPGRDVAETVAGLEALVAGQALSEDVLNQVVGWTIGSPEFQRR
jgi:uncharacterized protein (DUF1800 family)